MKPKPATQKPNTAAERERILATFDEDKATRLRGLYVKWLDPVENSLKDSELKELLRSGLVRDDSRGLGKGGATDIPDFCSQATFAEIVTELYGAPVNKMAITRAIANDGMPGRQKNGSIKTSLALPWWEQVKALKGGDASLHQRANEAEMQKKIDDAKRARMELEIFEQANSDKYVSREEVEKFLHGLGRDNSAAFTRALETNQHRQFCADLDRIVFDEDLKQQIRACHLARCRQTNDALQREFGAGGVKMEQPK